MTLYSKINLGIGCNQSNNCSGPDGCPEGIASDFCIKRNDTAPSFMVSMEDCNGVVDLSGNFVLEVSIWVKSKLRYSIDPSDTEIVLADNVGFDQISVGDVIITSHPRSPEKMLVTSIDESSKSISVQRAYASTPSIPPTPQSWPRGCELRVFRALDVEGQIESVYEDVIGVDGVSKNELVQTFLTYKFTEETSRFAGCYWLEFKLTELNEDLTEIVSLRKFPSEAEGFLIKIIDSPTEV